MIHLFLVAALALFVLWIIGLAGVWAAHTAWTLFIIACACLIVWAIAGGFSRGRRAA
jgi:hypothetical protein